MPLSSTDIDLVRAAAMSCDAETAAKLVDLADRMQEDRWIGDPPFANEWSERMRSLLGEEVDITINREDSKIVRGKLLSFNEGGEVAIREDDGFVSWAWPALEAVRRKP